MKTTTTPSTTARAVTFLLAAIALAVALILAGCALPIPPSGPDMGKYGTLYLTPRYEANALTTPYLTNWTNYVSTNQYK
jgi:hypothetical protein